MHKYNLVMAKIRQNGLNTSILRTWYGWKMFNIWCKITIKSDKQVTNLLNYFLRNDNIKVQQTSSRIGFNFLGLLSIYRAVEEASFLKVLFSFFDFINLSDRVINICMSIHIKGQVVGRVPDYFFYK